MSFKEEFLTAASLLSMVFKPEKKETPDSLKVIIDVSFSGNLILLHSVSLCHHVNTSLIPTSQGMYCCIRTTCKSNRLN